MLLSRADSQLLIVDIQQKLAPAIHDGAAAVANNLRLVAAARQLGIPVAASEQYVRGLGPTVPELRARLADEEVFEKIHFSCTREPGVLERLKATGRRQVVLTGMETHVCVLQTGMGLLTDGFDVFLVRDAASSRTPASREAAVDRLRAAGAHIVTTEMVMFEWLERAATDDFRALLPSIR